MDRKIYLSIVVASLLTLTGCMSNHHKHYFQDDINHTLDEPTLVVKPFHYTGRAWFDTDKAVLRTKARHELDGLAASLMTAKANGLISEKNRVVIIGHTDSRASRKYNQKLSERRAGAVATYLKSKGIPATSMIAAGRGELQPVASNRTHAGMQKNRRVEVHIQGEAVRVVYN